jgi:phosphoketolase
MHSYKPEEQFDHNGRLAPELAALAPRVAHQPASPRADRPASGAAL